MNCGSSRYAYMEPYKCSLVKQYANVDYTDTVTSIDTAKIIDSCMMRAQW